MRRLGEVRMPVEVRVEFADGREATRAGTASIAGRASATRGRRSCAAFVDPDGKIALDVDPANNSWARRTGDARRAASKWAARFLFWLQNLLELQTVLG